MLIYEKKVDDERHLFGSASGIPSEDDVQVTYTDPDGNEVEVSWGDSFVDAGGHSMKRVSDGKEVWAFVEDYNVIPGGKEQPSPSQDEYLHVVFMVSDNGSQDAEFNVNIVTDSEDEFTADSVELWLRENGYTTSLDSFYTDITSITGPVPTGVASKSEGVTVCDFGGSYFTATFMHDTVTPAN